MTEPYQKRVLAEREALDGKLLDLQEFLSAGRPEFVSAVEWGLLGTQSSVMTTYRALLDERIGAWGL